MLKSHMIGYGFLTGMTTGTQWQAKGLTLHLRE